MSRSAMILMREIDAGDHPPRHGRGVVQHAVDAEAHAHARLPSGSKWMSEAPLLDRLGDDRVDELDDRRVVGRLAQLDDLLDRRRPPRRRVADRRRRGASGG